MNTIGGAGVMGPSWPGDFRTDQNGSWGLMSPLGWIIKSRNLGNSSLHLHFSQGTPASQDCEPG